MKKDKTVALLKTVSMFLLYFIYTYFAGMIMNNIGIKDTTIGMFIADAIFLVIIVWVYAKNIKDDFKKLKKDKPSKIVKTVLLWVVVMFLVNILMGAITDVIAPNLATDENTSAISNLATISVLYTIFKTMIFTSIAEELLFRESLSEVIDNNTMFIIISALIYTIMNFIFTDTTSGNIIIYILMYLVPGLIFSYTKHDRNILLIMLIKFCYNIIPLLLLLFVPEA